MNHNNNLNLKNLLRSVIKQQKMDFSKERTSASCFSGQCGLCSSCASGDTLYFYPGYMDNVSMDYKETNWQKYQKMLQTVQENLTKVKDLYDE